MLPRNSANPSKGDLQWTLRELDEVLLKIAEALGQARGPRAGDQAFQAGSRDV